MLRPEKSHKCICSVTECNLYNFLDEANFTSDSLAETEKWRNDFMKEYAGWNEVDEWARGIEKDYFKQSRSNLEAFLSQLQTGVSINGDFENGPGPNL